MTLEELKKQISELGIALSDESFVLLKEYMDYVLKMNKEINLTAIEDEESYIQKMIYDSVLPLKLLDFDGKHVLDIGTGSGYPGTVIDTLTNARVDLLDSTSKKLNVISSFPNKKFNTIHARAEEYASTHRETYDIAIARAVSALNILLEIAIPLVKVNGYFVAMKGKEADAEIKEANGAFKKLNCHIERIDKVILPSGEERNNILIKKDKPTHKKYPREYKEIKRLPL